ncbi:hypothetical protein PINS_up000323 [Pythium insidiosum]|nr:hypothetical protein PINS_up000323 [Pythium insidiosum]
MLASEQLIRTVSVSSVLATCVVAFLIARQVFDRAARALRRLPRPASTLPVLGNTLDLLKYQRTRVHDWFFEQCVLHKGKPWVLSTFGRSPTIVISTEELFDDVLRKQFDNFGKGVTGSLIAKDLFGEGIFAVDGDKWRHQRKTASYLFSHQMMRDIMEQAVKEDSAQVCAILERAAQRGERVELKCLMDNYTTDVFTQIAFGARLGCLRGDQAFDPEFHKAFTRTPMAIRRRAQQPVWLWQLQKWLNVGAEKAFAKDMALVDATVNNIVVDAMERHAQQASAVSQESSDRKRRDLISLFLDGPSIGDIKPTPTLIRDMALNFIAAGRGTTAQTLVWVFVLLNRYKNVYDKVLTELHSVFPNLLETPTAVPTMEQVQRLPYLEATIKETMRLYPAIPVNSRTAFVDSTLSDGTFVPEGARVLIPVYAVGRMPWIWGDDAAEFKPERWIDAATGQLGPVPPLKFLAFNAGPRYCLGAKLAMLEMKVLLAAILSKFHVDIDRDPFQVSYAISLALPVDGELHVKVSPLSKEAVAESKARAA